MTVPNRIPRNVYSGTGSTGPFQYEFMIDRDEDLRVIRRDPNGVESRLLLNVDYTVSGAGLEDGGAVTLASPLAAGHKLALLSSMPITQETDYTNNDAFPASRHEAALDRIVRQVQQLEEKVGRALLLKGSSSPRDLLLPDPAAGKMLGWDISGTSLYNWPTTPLSVPNMDHIGNHADDLSQAVLDIGTSRQLLMIQQAIDLTSTVIVPADLQLFVPQGGVIRLGDHDLHLTSPPLADNYQIFEYTGAGRVYVHYAGHINPFHYGVVYDGVADDTVAAQRALDSTASVLVSTGAGAKVAFPKGGVLYSNGLDINNSHTEVLLEGKFLQAGGDLDKKYCFRVAQGTSRVKIHGSGIIDGNSDTFGLASSSWHGHGIKIGAGDQTEAIADIEVTGLTIRNMPRQDGYMATGDGLCIAGAAGHETTNVYCHGLTLLNLARDGITMLDYVRDSRVRANYIDIPAFTAGNGQSCIHMEPGATGTISGIVISGNNLIGGKIGLRIDGHGTIASKNTLRGQSLFGALVGQANAEPTTTNECIISENIFHLEDAAAVEAIALYKGVRHRVSGSKIFGHDSLSAIGVRSGSSANKVNDNDISGYATSGALTVYSGGAGGNDLRRNRFYSASARNCAIDLNSTGANRLGGDIFLGTITDYVRNVSATDIFEPVPARVNYAANGTLYATQNGACVDNTGATGPVTVNLPAAYPGMAIHWTRTANYAFRLDPKPDTDAFRGQSAGKYLELDTSADAITIRCIKAGIWDVILLNGTVAYES